MSCSGAPGRRAPRNRRAAVPIPTARPRPPVPRTSRPPPDRRSGNSRISSCRRPGRQSSRRPAVLVRGRWPPAPPAHRLPAGGTYAATSTVRCGASAVPRHAGAVPGQLDEGHHLVQDADRVWQFLLRLYLRLILRAQLVLDALAELSVPAPVDGPQDLAEARVVVPCHRGVELVTVHPVRWHGTRS